jgi:hypothetical protein
MNLEQVPEQITYNEVLSNAYSLSPIMYKKKYIKNKNLRTLRAILVEGNEYVKGNEPGSQWYLKSSDTYLIRTKALQDFSYLTYPKGEAIIPINPRRYKGTKLKRGDILISKDSNIGEAVIVAGDECDNCDFSSGIIKLNIKEEYNPFYVFACLKHSAFKEQLIASCPKGATIKHAGERWMDCYIVFPNQRDKEFVISYISDAVQIVMDMEKEIIKKSRRILEIITNELRMNQSSREKIYDYPRYDKVKKEKRLDAAIYCEEYENKIGLIEGYRRGYYTPDEDGFVIIPGPSLEIKLLKTRIDLNTYMPGFYQLLLPTNLSEFGTINKVQYLGTKKKLPLLMKGDILFGEAGFQKGRSVVLIDEIENCTTNAHGLYARRKVQDLRKSIYFRCIFDWYRNMGLIDLMAVGGSGGHFSPEYFEYIRIPDFPDKIVDEIVSQYSIENCIEFGVNIKKLKCTNLDECGIFQLNKEVKILKKHIEALLDKIINNEEVAV